MIYTYHTWAKKYNIPTKRTPDRKWGNWRPRNNSRITILRQYGFKRLSPDGHSDVCYCGRNSPPPREHAEDYESDYWNEIVYYTQMSRLHGRIVIIWGRHLEE